MFMFVIIKIRVLKKIIFTLLFPVISFGQIQLGTDINGQSGDLSGYSVSVSDDGETIAISSVENSNSNGFQSGCVRIYRFVSGVWTQIGASINGAAEYDFSGTRIALSADGNIIAIGASHHDNGIYGNSGHVRVYQLIAGSWIQIGAEINGIIGGIYSGSAVAVSDSGNILAINSYSNTVNGNLSGQVKIFQNITGIWTQLGNDINGQAAVNMSGLGLSLSADGMKVAIGAYGNDDNGEDSGNTRIYENIAGAWTQIGNDIDGESTGDYSGVRVSLSADGNTVAIGAIYNDGNGTDSGHVRVYKNMSGNWIQLGTDIDGQNPGDESGIDISLSANGTVLAIGSTGNSNSNGVKAGCVRVFQFVSGVWTQIGININGEAPEDYSGGSISLSADALKLAIGAIYNSGNGWYAGHVRVYGLSSILTSDEFSNQKFSITPNPSSTILNISIQDNSILEKVIIYNSVGQFIKTTTHEIVNVSDLAQGTYFIELTTDKGKATKSFIKE